MTHLRYDLKIISRLAIGMVGLYVLALLADAFSSFETHAFALGLIDGTIAAADIDQRANEIDQMTAALAIPLFAALLLAVIFSGVWIYRAAANASQLQPDPSRITPGWSIGLFFVPFANLVMPYQAMRETWNTSVDSSGDIKRGAPFWVTAWWILWVFINIVANFEAKLMMTIADAESMKMASTVSLVIAPFDLLCVILYILVIHRITDLQSNARPDVATTFA